MSETFLYMTTTGNKTGLPRLIEIWFVEYNDAYYIVAEHREDTSWVKNIRANASVTFSVGIGDDHDATLSTRAASARVVSPAAEPELAAAVSELMDAKYEWSDGTIVEITAEA